MQNNQIRKQLEIQSKTTEEIKNLKEFSIDIKHANIKKFAEKLYDLHKENSNLKNKISEQKSLINNIFNRLALSQAKIKMLVSEKEEKKKLP